MSNILHISSLAHSWILDLDGTVVKHNGYLLDGHDTLLEGAKEFLRRIPADDYVLFLTSRKEEYREVTENFLKANDIRYDCILFGAPYGERVLLNDRKPSGLATSYAVNKTRDSDEFPTVEVDENL